jgi:hypothetical protein
MKQLFIFLVVRRVTKQWEDRATKLTVHKEHLVVAQSDLGGQTAGSFLRCIAVDVCLPNLAGWVVKGRPSIALSHGNKRSGGPHFSKKGGLTW